MVIENEYIAEMVEIIVPATVDTIYMVSFSSFFALVIGGILGIILYTTQKDGLCENSVIYKILGTIINIGRSIPFVIILLAVFPLSEFIVGTKIGRTAAIVPLTVAAAPFVARLAESIFNDLGKGIIEAAIATGASTAQIIFKVLIPETISGLIMGITTTIINLIGYSAMAGIIGGGGLGYVADAYGFKRERNDVLFFTIIILIIMVQLIQATGSHFSRKFDKR